MVIKLLKKITISILYGNRLVAFFRIIMGMLFIFSGIFKVIDLHAFGTVIMKYNIIPEITVPYAAILLPFLELIVGLFLVTGFRIKTASLISMALMILFSVVISVNVIKGESFDCGCFELSRFGINEDISVRLIVRDMIFLIILIITYNAKRHYYSLDNIIEKSELTNL
jgi:putative oxidoreductase